MENLTKKTKAAVIQLAKWQKGFVESPAGSNKVKYNAWFYGREVSGKAYPWCMTFVQWVFHEVGFNLYKTASCGALMRRYKEFSPSQWVTSDYQPGDILIFDFSGRKTATQHCGILVEIDADGQLISMEGNTAIGNDCNGGAVLPRTRDPKFVTGAVRPKYPD